jgi:hypothetical protein
MRKCKGLFFGRQVICVLEFEKVEAFIVEIVCVFGMTP